MLVINREGNYGFLKCDQTKQLYNASHKCTHTKLLILQLYSNSPASKHAPEMKCQILKRL